MLDMSYEQWMKVIRPKVQGTWNLHKVTKARQEPLDFFLLYSSLGSISGQIGQANYSAANTFLDAFVGYRHSLGLPCCCLGVGIMEDVGYLSENQDTLHALKATAIHTVREQEYLDAVHLMLTRSFNTPNKVPASGYVSRSNVGLGVRSNLPILASNNRTIWRRDPRMLIYQNLEKASGAHSSLGSSDSEKFRSLMRDINTNTVLLESSETAMLLAKEIGSTLYGFMMRSDEEVELEAPLNVLGVDSLISVELKNWLRHKVGVEFSVLELVGASGIQEIARKAQTKLMEKAKARA
jgi:acyl carrier protein